jgi:hypothetical protein
MGRLSLGLSVSGTRGTLRGISNRYMQRAGYAYDISYLHVFL